ncbi:MAG TPA: TPM domain-containing protein, partial [Nocardioides sp.]|nr:TPM domain-containing protein [Nocardioides sp.]
MRRLLAVSGVCPVLVTALVALAAPAPAEEPACSTSMVEDGAGVLDAARIERTAAAFGDDLGSRVVVKVISYVTTDGQDLYDRVYAERQRCHGWGYRPGGGRSLLVLAVATEDRRLATHYDGRAQGRFAAARERAEVDGMGAGFGNGRWTRGMVDGLAIYARAYRRADSGPASGPATGGGSPVTEPPDEAAATESNEASPWLLVIPGGLVAGGVGWGGWVWVRRRRATREARASLSTAADDLAAAWVEVDEAREYVDARVGSLPSVDDSMVNRIRADHAAALADLEQATAAYLSLSQTYAVDQVARLDRDEAAAGVGPVTAA